MGNTVKKVLTYMLPLGLAGLLLWYQYKDTSAEALLNDFRGADYKWIFISIIPALISHLSRARRWILLIEPVGYKPRLSSTFLAVMSGYFANLILPRMGEVTRCGILQSSEKVPLSVSFGTVVAERTFDMFMLLIMVGMAFLLQFDTLSAFIGPLFTGKVSSFQSGVSGLMVLALLAVAIVTALLLAFRKRIVATAFYGKARTFAIGVWHGLVSVRKMKRKWEFFAHTLLIWVCYFLMTYLVFFAMPATQHLSLSIGLAIFAIGGLAMIAPVQGGVGAFHFMVGAGFMLYGLTKGDADAAALIMHTTQTLFIIVLGGLCFLLSFLFTRKEAKQPLKASEQH
jgi:glycosyltransferase 2 family protein